MLLSKISTSACLSFSLLLCFSFTVKDALQEAVSRDRCISWSNIHKAAAIQIPMDGVPFMACGQQTLVCQFGARFSLSVLKSRSMCSSMHWVRSLYSRARRPRPPRSFFLCDPDTKTMAVSSLARKGRADLRACPDIFLLCREEDSEEASVFRKFSRKWCPWHRRIFFVLPSPWSCHIFVSIHFSYETIMEFMSSGRSLWIFRSALSADGILWFIIQLTTVRNRSFLTIMNHKSFFLSWLLQNLEKIQACSDWARLVYPILIRWWLACLVTQVTWGDLNFPFLWKKSEISTN